MANISTEALAQQGRDLRWEIEDLHAQLPGKSQREQDALHAKIDHLRQVRVDLIYRLHLRSLAY